MYVDGIVQRGLAMAFLVARASRPCVSRASCPRFEGKMPSTRKSKAILASPRETVAKAFGLDDATRIDL
jgi:hypothetical protein